MGAGKLAQRNDEHFGESFANSLSSDRQSNSSRLSSSLIAQDTCVQAIRV